MAEYPEHDKLTAISDDAQICGGFVEWLREIQELHLTKWFEKRFFCTECGEVPENEVRGNGMYSDSNAYGFHKNNERCDADVEYVSAGYQLERRNIEELLAEFFGIDEQKLENEKRAMLDECRAMNE